jgi:ketosteroid isomerase-like protein
MKSKENNGKADRSHGAFRQNAEPFYQVILDGLTGEVDGEHFWDCVAEDAVFEFLYHFPGFTTRIEGRQAYMDWFAGYDNNLHRSSDLRVYKDREQGVVTMEYQLQGSVAGSGRKYDNRFCSVITIKDRKIVHWRDYCDSLAAYQSMISGS